LPLVRRSQNVLSIVLLCLVMCRTMHDRDDDDDYVSLQPCEVT